ncbi:carbohydrate ABC transporter permease [Microbacterium sulfonylureivorans]|uniref:carbohydrate ABC transporter permease n=1 Tax=Microbacterium sulfonylureivorans TaxID=2486854 RepID=UPI0013DEB9F2|nr:carbohydrate ABC transporter permease [Microbacterium sulfonylureivorans]
MSGSLVRGIVRYAIVGLFVLIWTIPIYLIVVNAITPMTSYTGAPVWWPDGFGLFDNLASALSHEGLLEGAVNSALYSVVASLAAVLVAACAAFAQVMMPLRRPKMLFWIIYGGALLPLQVFAFPLYIGSVAVNLYDTKTVLFIVYTALCIPFSFFLLRNFLITFTSDIAQAAKLDGAGWWRILFSVYLPLMRPALFAAFVLASIAVWNELFFGISLTISPENMPVMASLAGMQSRTAAMGQPGLLAAALLVSIPTIAIFLAFKRYFITGISANV